MRDLGVTSAIAPQVPEPAVPALVVLTVFGGPKLVAIASTSGSVLGVYSGRVEPARARRFLVAVALVLSVSVFVKYGLGMPRPPETLMAIPEDGYGFPSGHATAAAGLATAFVGVFRSEGRWLAIVAGAYVLVIAATRVLLGVHYLPDVLTGIVLGVVVATLGLRADRSRPRATVAAALVAVAVALPVWALS
ncbi:MAG: phosphatase PAP2 family protein [Halodesulfurarchaeum sp.]|nr:phosphatase PAP2 family protein [Halodesulfurarchaeum sp.]